MRLVVDNLACDLGPGVRAERPLLNAGHKLCVDSVSAKKADGDAGTLKAKRFFEIKDAGYIDGTANHLWLMALQSDSLLDSDGAVDRGITTTP
jgi:hypothetical protein